MSEIILKPVGIIKTPFNESTDIPVQGKFGDDAEGVCILNDEYHAGLNSLEEFSHVILIYHFHKVKEEHILSKPFLEDEIHGIFSIRSPYRPNKIGVSIVKITKIKENKLFFSEVDMLNDTPLIDIKPYVKYFDSRENTNAGWVEKHFKDNSTPERVILRR
jgi:tRNA-Thr(GGU) m(6)t(6)A37 methyltransferase TsaA